MYFSIPDILIVEDGKFNREVIAKRLHPCHYNLRFAVDGQQALDMVNEKKPDVILLDIILPDIMGLQILHTLRQQYSMVDLPIIMVTSIDEDERIVRAFELGANDYASKPINFPVLIARLQTQLSLKQLSALNNEFLSNASHDLRKPLALIQDAAASTRLKLSTQQPIGDEEICDCFSVIEESANFMNSIVECILNTQASGFGQIRLTKKPQQVTPLITETVNRHSAYASEKKIKIQCKLEANTPAIEVDRSRIAQVLDNLVDNAVKFCSSNDTITISTKSDKDSVSILVSDTGPGLKDDDFEHLFIKNTTLSNKPTNNEPQTGLGLSICKQLVDLHAGELFAKNNKGKGICFWFTLPAFKLKSV